MIAAGFTARLISDLQVLGVGRGDLVHVHASLRKIGLARSQGVSGGAELLLDALDAAVGPEGTLLITLGSEYRWDWVNEQPPEARADLLEGSEPFEAATAPAQADVGWLAEAFRQRDGTLVSANPSGRFGARGAKAADLLADQPWHDYYGPHSPLDKLCRWGGKVLRLGAEQDTVTALHFAEYLAQLPGKRRVRYDYLLALPEGPRHCWMECLDDNQGIADWPAEDYFAAILKAYLREGNGRTGQVGEARSELLDVADLVGFGTKWMEANLRP